MTKLEEVEEEIKKLENKECLTYDIVHKLADLYTVRSYMMGSGTRSMMSSPAPAMTSNMMK
jgi:hypothetical protein